MMEGVVEKDKVTVKQVCQDFRVREDGALASKLQDEEFEKHYGRNKSERKTVRGDVRVAKQTYLEEVRTAHLLPEDELVDMEETDKWLAKDLQDKLHSEERREMNRQEKIATRDAKMAKHLQEREKETFDKDWHKRREEETLGREKQEREHREMERDEVDKKTELELRDAQMAKDLQERERQKYERERQRRKEREMMRRDGPERDRRREPEYRDHARTSRDPQERERQKRMDRSEIDRQRERNSRTARDPEEHERQKRMDRSETDRQREMELRDAKTARDPQERERQKRMDGPETDRQREMELRDARTARDPEELERQKRMDGPETDRQREMELRDARTARDPEEHERQKRMDEREVDRQKKMELHDARTARDPEELERQKRMDEREVDRQREMELRDAIIARDLQQREKRKRMNGPEIDRQRELELRDAVIARDLQERERQKSMDRPETEKQRELELRDARMAKDLQEREKQKFDREWQRRREQEILEDQERRHYQRSASEPTGKDRDIRRPPTTPSEDITVNGHPEPVIEKRKNHSGGGKEDKRKSTSSSGSGGSIDKAKWQPKGGQGEEAVVALPTSGSGGGRLEHDRIIMADGTEIRLFEGEEEKQKDEQTEQTEQTDLELERVKKDEEYAKMLQDQERRIVEAEKMAAEDKRRALEEQDRELAKQLQRKEYHRMQQERKDRQMRRANSVPSDRLSVNLQDPRRLPSYAEATTHRHHMPDLLPENHLDNDCNRYSYMSTNSSGGVGSQPSSLEREVNLVQMEGEKDPTEQKHGRSPRGTERLITRGPQHSPERDVELGDAKYMSGDRGSSSKEDRQPPIVYVFTRDEGESRQSPRESGSLKDHGRSDRSREHEHNRDERDKREPSREQGYSRDDRHPPQGYVRDDIDGHQTQGCITDDADDRKPARKRDTDDPPSDDVRSRDRREEREPSPTENECLIQEKDLPNLNHDANNSNCIWLTREPGHISPPSSLERCNEDGELTRESVRASYASSGQSSYDRKSQTSGHSGSPPLRADVWERFDNEDDSHDNRQIIRSRTVTSSQPTQHDSEQHISYNVVEGIDPTFRRKPKRSDEDPMKTDENSEEKAKVITLIKPHRRRSAEKKKDRTAERERAEKAENCKQQ